MSRCKKLSSSINLESYRKMVAQHAWSTWKKLPAQTRWWISVEDMIEDGMAMAFRFLTKGKHKYNPQWSTFSTALYHRLHKFYVNEYIEKYLAMQRGCIKVNGKLVAIPHTSIQAMQLKLSVNGDASVDDVVGRIPDLVTSPDSIYSNMLTQCFVVPSLVNIYQRGSLHLQGEFINWFWYANKVHKKGKPFEKAAKEFRELALPEQLTLQDCTHIMRSPECLNTLSMKLFDLPYDHACMPVIGQIQ
jgi:hypothetical protein